MIVSRTPILRKFLFLAFILLSSAVAKTQPGSGPPGNPGNPDVPITGIEILIGAGGAFGLKKILENRKKKAN
jgi:hypothetical protein